MTIKKKIYSVGGITFFIFIVLALMNIWTHQQVLSTVRARDQVRSRLSGIEKFARWKNEMIRSVSDIVASGHVPPHAYAQFEMPFPQKTANTDVLISTGKTLVSLIGEKERASIEVETTFDEFRQKINELYFQLDREIATVMAVAQMDQVLGRDNSEQTSLSPYVLKSLNQLTLVALNSIIARSYTSNDKGVVERNRQFLYSQINIIDSDGSISAYFEELFFLIDSLDGFIKGSSLMLKKFDAEIVDAKMAFDRAVGGTEIETALAGAQSEAATANKVLERASRRTLITVIVFLFLAPVFVMVVGIIGLNSIIIEPITHLVDAMRNVKEGSFDVAAPIKAHDEIGELASAFNAMAVEIKAKVTELSRLNQVLQESETKYRTLVDNLPQRIFLKNRDSVYVSCNRNYARDRNTSESDIVGKTDFDFFPQDLAEKYKRDDQKVLTGHNTIEVEENYIVAGEKIIVQTVKTPIRNEQGDVWGVLGIFWDITKRKRDEEDLHLARFSLENASVGILWVDSGGRIQYVNQQVCQYLGYAGHELILMPIWEIDPSFSPSIYAETWRETRDGRPKLFETSHRRKNGEIFPVEISVRQGEYKGVRLYFAFITDITGRKQAEDEKQKLQIQLQQSRKMEAIGTLAGGIAHDFNNLLQAINGYTQIMLMDKSKTDPDHPRLMAIDQAGRRAGRLVRQLLLFSRKVEAEKKMVNLNHEIVQVGKILNRTIPKMIGIELDLADDLWTINADPIQIEQILLNLGSNAADAMPEGGKLLIKTENARPGQAPEALKGETDLQRSVLLTVSDNGLGMAKDSVEHIFEPFYTTKEVGKGTGLGLASVYGIVKSHGGKIICESESGQGTLFKIFFPALHMVQQSQGRPLESQAPHGESETILIVDDEAPIRNFASEALSKFNYGVIAASSGEEALDVYRRKQDELDLVILDIGMPGMGGQRCLQEIIQMNSEAKVIIASGYAPDKQLKSRLETGRIEYISKPYRLAELLEKVRMLLGGLS